MTLTLSVQNRPPIGSFGPAPCDGPPLVASGPQPKGVSTSRAAVLLLQRPRICALYPNVTLFEGIQIVGTASKEVSSETAGLNVFDDDEGRWTKPRKKKQR
jgi:hypothetical protein